MSGEMRDMSHCGDNSFSPQAPWCDNHVPEPSTWALIILGIILVFFFVKRKK